VDGFDDLVGEDQHTHQVDAYQGIDHHTGIRLVSTPGTGVSATPQSGPSITTRRNTFTLDRSKQIKRLNKDTIINDFEITINPSNENVNIQCNAGFYAKVAKPALEDLAFGPSPTIEDITIKCHDITNRSDATGAATTTLGPIGLIM